METLALPGAPLVRQSSFERKMMMLYASMPHNVLDKVADIQTWYRAAAKMKRVRSDLVALRASIEAIVSVYQGPETATFERMQSVLNDTTLRAAMDKLLSTLPKDVNLKSRNSITRTCRFHLTSLIISRFPEELLVTDVEPDTSSEAQACTLAAKLMTIRFLRLLKLFLSDGKCPLSTFKRNLLAYRFSVRHYFDSFETWKQLDFERMKQTLEMAFVETYSLYLSTVKIVKESVERNENEVMLLNNLLSELSKIEYAMRQMYQNSHSNVDIVRVKIEELTAIVEAKFASDNEAMQSAIHEVVETDDDTEGGSHSNKMKKNVPVIIKISNFIHEKITGIINNERLANGKESFLPPKIETLLDVTTSFIRNNNSIRDAVLLDKNQILYELLKDRNFHFQPVSGFREGLNLESYRYRDGLSSRKVLNNNANNNDGGNDVTTASPNDHGSASNSGNANNSNSNSNGETMTSLMSRLRGDLECVLDDRTFASVLPAKIDNISEVRVGDVVMVGTVRPRDGLVAYYHFAEVTAIHNSNNSNNHMDNNESDNGHSNVSSNGVTFDIRYLCDGYVESNIATNRVKLSSTPSLSMSMLGNLQDVLMKAASLTPSRNPRSLLDALTRVIDMSLLQQMIEKNSLGSGDMMPLVSTVLQLLRDFHAPVRLGSYDTNCRALLGLLSSSTPLSQDNPLTCVAHQKHHWMRFIPLFFKFCDQTIDIIAMDIANYYLSLLVPLLAPQPPTTATATSSLPSSPSSPAPLVSDRQICFQYLALVFAQKYTIYSLSESAILNNEDNDGNNGNNSNDGSNRIASDSTANSGGNGSNGNNNNDLRIDRTIQFLLKPISTRSGREALWQDLNETGGLGLLGAAVTAGANTISANQEGSSVIDYRGLFVDGKLSKFLDVVKSGDSSNQRDVFLRSMVFRAYLQLLERAVYLRLKSFVDSNDNNSRGNNNDLEIIIRFLTRTIPEISLGEVSSLVVVVETMVKVMIEVGLLVAMKQIMMRLGVISYQHHAIYAQEEKVFLARIDSLLSESLNIAHNSISSSGTSGNSAVGFDNIFIEAIQFIERYCRSSLLTITTSEWKSYLEKELKNMVFSEQSKVMQLFCSRLSKLVLLVGNSGSNVASLEAKLQSFSFNHAIIARNANQVIKRSNDFFAHIYQVHYLIYENILSSDDFQSLFKD